MTLTAQQNTPMRDKSQHFKISAIASRFDQHGLDPLVDAAARVMQEECEPNPARALKTAARRLGAAPNRWPSEAAVREALRARLRLFESNSVQRVRSMQMAALEAMQQMQQFEPHAIGGIVDGALPSGSAIAIELFAAHADDVRHWLMELKVPFAQRFAALEPRFEFRAGEFSYCLLVVSDSQKRDPLGIGVAAFAKQLASEPHN